MILPQPLSFSTKLNNFKQKQRKNLIIYAVFPLIALYNDVKKGTFTVSQPLQGSRQRPSTNGE